MNPYYFFRNLLILGCACLGIAACQTGQSTASNPASSQGGGHLVVHRAPSLGGGLIVKIDGGNSTDLRVGDTLNRDLTPGQHVVSVVPAPNEQNQAPSSVTVTVVEGQTYNFTAVVRGGLITLIKGT
jgi:hypothetical protein